ncbi:hypothetical protein P280DRAFT_472164 [Massarina eburnea CBS 473.64]|uniref:Ribosomal protein S21 n=1 Tax=Massarina eburnea CBS 473.64 TaxID=1395130 RepID=A0A6A6RQI7_9PLEO|nr:hypothetical protein P280DRAFT_472164 [Massarina eburnea CBS 473.64]
MGSRSMGEWLLRPTALSRLSLTFPQPYMTARLALPAWTSQRALTSSAPSNSAQPQLKEENEQNEQNEQNEHNSPSSSQSEPSQPSQPAANPFADLMSSIPRFKGPHTQNSTTDDIDSLLAGTNDPRFNRTSYAPRPTNSSDGLQRAFGDSFSRPRPRAHREPLDFGKMQGLSQEAMDKADPKEAENALLEANYPRLNASYGRMVELNETRGRDLVRGISILGGLMSRNRVRADFNKQRFHERPGLKRKRLKSERWRARFKAGFKEVTARVTELTRKGW